MNVRSELENKRDLALRPLRDAGSVLVALSGGVDSAVLLALALEALGPRRVLAATGRSASLPAADLEAASRVAVALGARHRIVETRELERPAYRANAGDRCYHCRSELFEVLAGLARRDGLAALAYGAILDDAGDFRPGMRAAAERRVLAPLLEARITKQDVRELAAGMALPVADRPAAACLASRLPVGTAVTPERLSQVERAEAALRGLGLERLRVRHHGDVARIEVDPGDLDRLLDRGLRARVVEAVRGAGFRFVALDLEGYRTGSLNPLIPTVNKS